MTNENLCKIADYLRGAADTLAETKQGFYRASGLRTTAAMIEHDETTDTEALAYAGRGLALITDWLASPHAEDASYGYPAHVAQVRLIEGWVAGILTGAW